MLLKTRRTPSAASLASSWGSSVEAAACACNLVSSSSCAGVHGASVERYSTAVHSAASASDSRAFFDKAMRASAVCSRSPRPGVTSKDNAIPLRNIKCRCASPSGQANRDQFVPFGLRRESAMVEADKSAGTAGIRHSRRGQGCERRALAGPDVTLAIPTHPPPTDTRRWLPSVQTWSRQGLQQTSQSCTRLPSHVGLQKSSTVSPQ